MPGLPMTGLMKTFPSVSRARRSVRHKTELTSSSTHTACGKTRKRCHGARSVRGAQHQSLVRNVVVVPLLRLGRRIDCGLVIFSVSTYILYSLIVTRFCPWMLEARSLDVCLPEFDTPDGIEKGDPLIRIPTCQWNACHIICAQSRTNGCHCSKLKGH